MTLQVLDISHESVLETENSSNWPLEGGGGLSYLEKGTQIFFKKNSKQFKELWKSPVTFGWQRDDRNPDNTLFSTWIYSLIFLLK